MKNHFFAILLLTGGLVLFSQNITAGLVSGVKGAWKQKSFTPKTTARSRDIESQFKELKNYLFGSPDAEIPSSAEGDPVAAKVSKLSEDNIQIRSRLNSLELKLGVSSTPSTDRSTVVTAIPSPGRLHVKMSAVGQQDTLNPAGGRNRVIQR